MSHHRMELKRSEARASARRVQVIALKARHSKAQGASPGKCIALPPALKGRYRSFIALIPKIPLIVSKLALVENFQILLLKSLCAMMFSLIRMVARAMQAACVALTGLVSYGVVVPGFYPGLCCAALSALGLAVLSLMRMPMGTRRN